MYPHRMRLHGPWHYEPLARSCIHSDGRIDDLPGPLPAAGTMKIPTVWHGTPLDGFRGRVRWNRKFHGPRALEPHERLWLVFDGVDYFANVSLNGQPLGGHEGYFERFDFDVTPLVRPRNELVVDVACPAEADAARPRMARGRREELCRNFVGGIWRDVALEVRSVAFLRDVRVATRVEGNRGVISATGLVVGDAGTRLGLELSVDGRHAASQRVEATLDPLPFGLETSVEPVEFWRPRGSWAPRTYAIGLELHGHARTLDAASLATGFRPASWFVDAAGSSSAPFSGRRQTVVLRDLVTAADAVPPTTLLDFTARVGAKADPNELTIWRTCGEVLPPDLYARADRDGIVLLQDAPTPSGCRELLDRLAAHHPSVVLFWDEIAASGRRSDATQL